MLVAPATPLPGQAPDGRPPICAAPPLRSGSHRAGGRSHRCLGLAARAPPTEDAGERGDAVAGTAQLRRGGCREQQRVAPIPRATACATRARPCLRRARSGQPHIYTSTECPIHFAVIYMRTRLYFVQPHFSLPVLMGFDGFRWVSMGFEGLRQHLVQASVGRCYAGRKPSQAAAHAHRA